MTKLVSRPCLLPASLGLLLLSGCTGAATCGDSHPYLDNRERPPLAAPAGVSVPAPDPAYVIPQAPGPAGACAIKPPDVLGPLGTPAAISSYAPTITRHRHGKAVNETKSTKAPGSATQAAPAMGTANPPAAGTQSSPPVAGKRPME
jgi:hypothetical protein